MWLWLIMKDSPYHNKLLDVYHENKNIHETRFQPHTYGMLDQHKNKNAQSK